MGGVRACSQHFLPIVRTIATPAETFDQLTEMLTQRTQTAARALPIYGALIEPRVCLVDEEIAPGLSALTWSSLNIDTYLARVRAALDALSITITKVGRGFARLWGKCRANR